MTLEEFKSVEEAVKYIACLRDNKNKGCKTEGEAFDAFVAHHDYLGANNLMFEIIQHLQAEIKRKDALIEEIRAIIPISPVYDAECKTADKDFILGFLIQIDEKCKQALAEQQSKEG